MFDQTPILTNDRLIRTALKRSLERQYAADPMIRIIEELGIKHGAVRVDLALINGGIHGFELKSDKDTLSRLPYQMRVFNTVLDRVTLVVGKNHLYEAINMIPEWWGMIVAKSWETSDTVSFYKIREAGINPDPKSNAIVQLLWRQEALNILEELGCADGVRSKNRDAIYSRLTDILDIESLRTEVVDHLCARSNWRSDPPYRQDGD